MEVNKIIKNRRIELQLTLKDVAKALGVAESTVSRYETSDIQNMGIDKIKALASVLKCSPGYLMGWETLEYNTDNLSKEETLLLANYNKLNQKGKEKLLDYSDDLTNNIKYMRFDDISNSNDLEFNTIAAHDDDLTEEEKENSFAAALECIKKHNK